MRSLTAYLLVALSLLLASCGERVYDLTFAGHTCEIPCSYFPPFARPGGPKPYNLILDYYIPDFTSRPTRPLDPKYQGGHGDRITATLNVGERSWLASYASMASARAENATYSDFAGLRQVEFRQWAQKPSEKNHILLYRAEGSVIKSLINCNPNPRSPPCEHWFNHAGIAFKLTYSLRHLTEWRRIESGTRTMFERLCR
jgi:hypothetical protein